MAPLDTLLLDQVTWDIMLDASGNLAIASPPYAVAQDVASAVKARLGEVWYNTGLGVDYANILGKTPPIQYMKAQFVEAALTVPGVVSAVCFLSELGNRVIGGQVQVTTSTGTVLNVGF